MSSVESLKEFVSQRLSAAAEEIFRVFKETIVEYEEELDRLRRLPEITSHRAELPQQPVCVKKQLCFQERSSSLDQGGSEPLEIKKEQQEEQCTSQKEGEQLVVKQETDTFVLTPAVVDRDHSEDHSLCTDPDETLHGTKVMPVIVSVSSQSAKHQQLLSNISGEAGTQDLEGDKHEDSGSRGDAEPEPKKRPHRSRSGNPTKYIVDSDPSGQELRNKSLESGLTDNMNRHPLSCSTCGKSLCSSSNLKHYSRIHTGEKPYSCDTCQKTFSQISQLKAHTEKIEKVHTGEKPYSCGTCGKRFSHGPNLKRHLRVHTGEKPHFCDSCGKHFSRKANLIIHRKTHTGEKPHSCSTCGKNFSQKSNLISHLKIHTGEKPYSCDTCGNRFRRKACLIDHVRIHTGEKPHSCSTCGKSFTHKSNLVSHQKIHRDE